MGSSVEKAVKRPLNRLNKDLITRNFDRGRDFATDIRRDIEKPFRTGASKQQRNVKKAGLLQQQRETIRLAEAEDEVAQRRGLASSKRGGRQSLIRSSGGGIVKTLGGV